MVLGMRPLLSHLLDGSCRRSLGRCWRLSSRCCCLGGIGRLGSCECLGCVSRLGSRNRLCCIGRLGRRQRRSHGICLAHHRGSRLHGSLVGCSHWRLRARGRRRRWCRGKHPKQRAPIGSQALEAIGREGHERHRHAILGPPIGEAHQQLHAGARDTGGAGVAQRAALGARRRPLVAVVVLEAEARDEVRGRAPVLLGLLREARRHVLRELRHPRLEHRARVDGAARVAAPPAEVLRRADLLCQRPLRHGRVVQPAREPPRLLSLLVGVRPLAAQHARHRRRARPPDGARRVEARRARVRLALAQQLAELAAKAAQPIDGERVEQRRDGARREQRLLVGLVQPAAQLGEQLVGRDARRAREAELARHLAPRPGDDDRAGREERLVVVPLGRRARPPSRRRLVDLPHHLATVAGAERVAREHAARLRAALGLVGRLGVAGHVGAAGRRRIDDLGGARGARQRPARWDGDVDVDLVDAGLLGHRALATRLADDLEHLGAVLPVDAHVALAVRGRHLH